MQYKISPKNTVKGHAFGEFIRTESYTRRRYSEGGPPKSIRGFLLPVFLLLTIILLSGRMLQLTLFQGSYFRALSDSNRIRTTLIHAPRGIIFDRNGVPLVYNIPGYRKLEKEKTILLSQQQALPLLAKNDKTIEIDSLRLYPGRDALAHVLGYIGQITEDDLKNSAFASYTNNDLLGKSGIEEEYEATLRGTDGKKLVEVDATGKVVRNLGDSDPIPGQNLTTTLDKKLQEKAFEAMADVKKGSVVVSTPQGEILALVSKPSFDPNLFTMGEHYKAATSSGYPNIAAILTDGTTQPLLNRAISGTYPPGSTFKLVTAAAGLEKNIIDENFQVNDTGILKVGAFSFGNWYFMQYGKMEGEVNVVKAIKRSNDIFFYKLAEKVGIERLSEVAKQFGIGRLLGIDLPGEARGILPTEAWKMEHMKEGWYLGDTYHYGIGQGYLLTTPLQVNAWTVALANGGTLYRPHVVPTMNQPVLTKIPLSPKTIALIHEGMKESCSTGGVAWPFFEFKVKNPRLEIDNKNIFAAPESTASASMKDYRKITVACKTGTAQWGGEKDLPHAWITLFAPAKDPQIVVTVLSESSGEGSNVAAPVAKKILEEWFSR